VAEERGGRISGRKVWKRGKRGGGWSREWGVGLPLKKGGETVVQKEGGIESRKRPIFPEGGF